MSHSQFHSTNLFILRHAWLNLWDKHMTTGRINQVTTFREDRFTRHQRGFQAFRSSSSRFPIRSSCSPFKRSACICLLAFSEPAIQSPCNWSHMFQMHPSLLLDNKVKPSTVKATNNRPTITMDEAQSRRTSKCLIAKAGLAISKQSAIILHCKHTSQTDGAWLQSTTKRSKFNLMEKASDIHSKSVHPDRQAHLWLGPEKAGHALIQKAYST